MLLENLLHGYQYLVSWLTAMNTFANKFVSATFVALTWLIDNLVQIIPKIGLLVVLDLVILPYLLFKSIAIKVRASWENSVNNTSMLMRMGLVLAEIGAGSVLSFAGFVIFNVLWIGSLYIDLIFSIIFGVEDGWTTGFQPGIQKLSERMRLGFKLRYNNGEEHLEMSFFDAVQKIWSELGDILRVEWDIDRFLFVPMMFSLYGEQIRIAERLQQLQLQLDQEMARDDQLMAQYNQLRVQLDQQIDQLRAQLTQDQEPIKLNFEQFKQIKLSNEALYLIMSNHQRLSIDEMAHFECLNQPEIQTLLAHYKELIMKIEQEECPISTTREDAVLLFKKRYQNQQWVLDQDAVPHVFNENALQHWCVHYHAVHPVTQASLMPLSDLDITEGSERYQYHTLQQGSLLVSEHLNQLTAQLRRHLNHTAFNAPLSVANNMNGIFYGRTRTALEEREYVRIQRTKRFEVNINDEAAERNRRYM